MTVSGSRICQANHLARCMILSATGPSVPRCSALLTFYDSYASLVGEQLPQDELQDPAVAEIALLLGRVDPHGHGELFVVSAHRQLAGNLVGIGQAGDRERLVAGQPQRA